jgi:hypothetical protein
MMTAWHVVARRGIPELLEDITDWAEEFHREDE